jgi:hypothetical protein
MRSDSRCATPAPPRSFTGPYAHAGHVEPWHGESTGTRKEGGNVDRVSVAVGGGGRGSALSCVGWALVSHCVRTPASIAVSCKAARPETLEQMHLYHT